MRYKILINWPRTAAKGDILTIGAPKVINNRTFVLASDGKGWEDWVNKDELEYFGELVAESATVNEIDNSED